MDQPLFLAKSKSAFPLPPAPISHEVCKPLPLFQPTAILKVTRLSNKFLWVTTPNSPDLLLSARVKEEKGLTDLGIKSSKWIQSFTIRKLAYLYKTLFH